MKQILIAIAAIVLSASFLAAQDLPMDQQPSIQTVIEDQLEAFASDDGATAFSFAAPIIKQAFSDPEVFMDMVKRGYAPVYRNKSREFGELFLDQLGRVAQRVKLTALDGKRYEAIYTMEKQPDGSWKISGCYIIQLPETGV